MNKRNNGLPPSVTLYFVITHNHFSTNEKVNSMAPIIILTTAGPIGLEIWHIHQAWKW